MKAVEKMIRRFSTGFSAGVFARCAEAAFPRIVFALLAAFASPSLARAAAAFEPTRPNVIVVLANDVGYGDLSCYGARHVVTPNLDRLAAQGCRFTDAHSAASTGTPSRRAFVTGVYSWRQAAGAFLTPGDAALTLAPGTTTVASLLKQAGYRTGVVGVWHLGLGPEGGPNWNGEITPGPLDLGFDSAFILPTPGDCAPTVFVENRRVVGLDPRDPLRVNYQEKIGNEPTGRENPEQLKLQHSRTHTHDMTIVNGIGRFGWMSGGQAARWRDEEVTATLNAKAEKFLADNKDGPFFLLVAPHSIHVPRVPHPRFQGASSSGPRGDALLELDDSVGKLLARLDELRLNDRTLFVFTSVNGGLLDDGYRDVGRTSYSPNAPLRGSKGTLFEGGTRVPFLVRWPGHIRPGTTSDALLAQLDLPASFAALAGAKIPAGECRDSVNLLPVLLGAAGVGRENLVTHHSGTKGPFGLRLGLWKLLQPGSTPAYIKYGDGRIPTRSPVFPELYNLRSDLAETIDLAELEHAKLRELQALLAQLRSER